MKTVCWFRTDLRLNDQPALAAAAAQGSVIGLFIASPGQWRLHHDAPLKVDFWLRAVKHLRTELEALNIPLKILLVEHWKDVPKALLEFCQRHHADQVHCNREHGVHERTRDRGSYSLLAKHNISLQGHHGGTLLIPGSVKTGADAYYCVFTPFSKACREKLRTAPYRLAPAIKRQPNTGLPASDDFPDALT
ncbi:MAG: deoxyribodipyrimidine photo-lyase, partial [Alcaligenaceae bacterium]